MRIPCSPSQFYDACVCIGLDVVDDVVYIPTDMADELSLRVEDVSDGVEIHFTPNMFIINVLVIIRQRLGIAATFMPVASHMSPLHANTDSHYRQTYLKTYPHLMFTLIPWLNQEIPQQHVYDVYNMCTPTSRHAIMLLARLVGFGGRVSSLNRLFNIVSHGTTPQLTRIILNIVAAHDLSDDDMLRWSEWAEGHVLKDILLHKMYDISEPVADVYDDGPEMKTQPPLPPDYVIFRGLQTCVRRPARYVRRRVEDVLRTCGVPFERHGDWHLATPTLHIYLTQRIMEHVIISVEPQYDDEVTLTHVWKHLRRITL